jgi:hypothetical protein
MQTNQHELQRQKLLGTLSCADYLRQGYATVRPEQRVKCLNTHTYNTNHHHHHHTEQRGRVVNTPS